MNYIYKRPQYEAGYSTAADIIFGFAVFAAIVAFSIWYTHNSDKLVDQGCVAAGYAGCSTFSNTPVK